MLKPSLRFPNMDVPDHATRNDAVHVTLPNLRGRIDFHPTDQTAPDQAMGKLPDPYFA